MPAADPIDRLPHRPPFRFLTALDAVEPGVRAQGLWRLTGDEDFFRGHFPDNPIVPGVLISEALAQLSGLVGASRAAVTSGTNPAVAGTSLAYLAHIDIKFTAPVSPPADIRLFSTLDRSMGPLSMYTVRAEIHGEAVASGSLVLSTRSGS